VELMSIGIEAIRTAIGLVFLASGVSKLRDVGGFVHGVKEYRILPDWLATAFGFSLIPIEMILGLCLVTGWLLRYSLFFGLLLLVSFFIAVGVNIRRHRELPCYCFGTNSVEPISKRTLARIVFLTSGMVVVLLGAQMSIAAVGFISPDSLTVGQHLVIRMLKGTLAIFVLVTGKWILTFPNLLHLLRGSTLIWHG